MSDVIHTDYLIIGAGIAGASTGWCVVDQYRPLSTSRT